MELEGVIIPRNLGTVYAFMNDVFSSCFSDDDQVKYREDYGYNRQMGNSVAIL